MKRVFLIIAIPLFCGTTFIIKEGGQEVGRWEDPDGKDNIEIIEHDAPALPAEVKPVKDVRDAQRGYFEGSEIDPLAAYKREVEIYWGAAAEAEQLKNRLEKIEWALSHYKDYQYRIDDTKVFWENHVKDAEDELKAALADAAEVRPIRTKLINIIPPVQAEKIHRKVLLSFRLFDKAVSYTKAKKYKQAVANLDEFIAIYEETERWRRK